MYIIQLVEASMHELGELQVPISTNNMYQSNLIEIGYKDFQNILEFK